MILIRQVLGECSAGFRRFLGGLWDGLQLVSAKARQAPGGFLCPLAMGSVSKILEGVGFDVLPKGCREGSQDGETETANLLEPYNIVYVSRVSPRPGQRPEARGQRPARHENTNA